MPVIGIFEQRIDKHPSLVFQQHPYIIYPISVEGTIYKLHSHFHNFFNILEKMLFMGR